MDQDCYCDDLAGRFRIMIMDNVIEMDRN
jgi:hypothetical protein